MGKVRMMGLGLTMKAAQLEQDPQWNASSLPIDLEVVELLHNQLKIFSDLFGSPDLDFESMLPDRDAYLDEGVVLVEIDRDPPEESERGDPIAENGIRFYSSPDIEASADCSDPLFSPVPTPEQLNTEWMIPRAVGTASGVATAMNVASVPAFAKPIESATDPIIAVFDGGIGSEAKRSWLDAPGAPKQIASDTQLEWHGAMAVECLRIAAPFAELWDVPILKSLTTPTLASAFAGLSWLISKRDPNRPLVATNPWAALDDPLAPPPAGHQGSFTDWNDYVDNPFHPFAILAQVATQAGITMVFAAGNCGVNGWDPACGTSADIGAGKSIRGVNGARQVLSVAAADLDGNLLSNSSPGPSTYLSDLSSPSDGLASAKPDLSGYSGFAGNKVSFNLGTSAACSVVAGGAALLLREAPTLAPEDVRLLLRNTAKRPTSDDCYSYFWGAGLIDLGAAVQQGVPKKPTKAAPLVKICADLLGYPSSCRLKLEELCANRQQVFDSYALSAEERDALEKMDAEAFARLLEPQVRYVLTEAWADRSVFSEQTDTPDTVACEGDAGRPMLLLNLIADLGESAEARRGFRDHRARLLDTRYALTPGAREHAVSMTPETVARDAARATAECVSVGSDPDKLHPLYPNVQSFPGPWIENFSPSSGELGDRAVKIVVEGRGFALRHPLVVGLVQRCIDGERKCEGVPDHVEVSQTVPSGFVGQPGPGGSPILSNAPPPNLDRQRLLDEACLQLARFEPPDECEENGSNIELGDVRYTEATIGPSRMRLSSLQLGAKYNDAASTPLFRLEAYLDLGQKEGDKYRLTEGDYDLWVGFCDGSGCESKGAVGPTVFRVRAPK